MDGDVATAGAVPFGEVVASINGEARAVEPVVAVMRVDLESLNHPPKTLRINGDKILVDPRSLRRAHGIVLILVRVRSPLPDLGPSSTRISRTEDLGIGPPRVERRHHDGPRFLQVNGEATEAEVEVVARRRCDVFPGAGGDVVPVDGALCAVVRSASVAVAEVEGLLLRLEPALVWEVSARLAGDSGPSLTRVVGDVDRSSSIVCGANEDSLGPSVRRRAGGVVKGDEGETLDVVVVAVGIRRIGHVRSYGREGRDLGKRDPSVSAAVEALAATSAEIDYFGIVGVYG